MTIREMFKQFEKIIVRLTTDENGQAVAAMGWI